MRRHAFVRADQAVLDDLQERLLRFRAVPSAHRHGDPLGGGSDDSAGDLGVPAGLLSALLEHWRSGYDWRVHEDRVAAHPWFETERTAVPLRAVVREAVVREAVVREAVVPDVAPATLAASGTSDGPSAPGDPGGSAAPVVLLLHGWPDSVLRFERLFPLLSDVTVVAPALPGFPFAAPVPQGGLSSTAMADAVAAAMEEFGFARYVVSAGDVGCDVAEALAARHPGAVSALHLTDVSQYHFLHDVPADLDAEERAYLARGTRWQAEEGGYMHEQATRPNTLAVGLGDSPAGLAAWITEKLLRWSDGDGSLTDVFSLDEALTWITAYWVSGTVGTSFTPYAAAGAKNWSRVEVPTVVTVFAHDLVNAPRRFAERFFDVVQWREYERGGHFAAWERPGDYLWGVRAAVDHRRSG
ncbi:pimeloyl-ACP methyl ester carboxylesterase [Kineococcus radiotolerans]|uniref:Pimeloyl-ACP methyl ester carboxylesterase n=1 Tax=Kineococcus radiotolerans TaxID=131568 RepID=A0A7W4TQT8_KINRA|nr:alpha/beta fold hydrolase [Kineococcus radiotolerans]MBB2903425.1 pimeloyl-ACP methyl ester carboxylesterase [Kineococcus radiotolerans]